ncbi:hypothetical protein QYM36_014972 [Artemia franciscana]|uniref:Uncharacterized protein n=1 Tax=Artemia franciscana TaxID=6661 RepID=A0AA88L453_ARTSF|nr:hypothetical protein QYM36_014972 [Artemia franciscana]
MDAYAQFHKRCGFRNREELNSYFQLNHSSQVARDIYEELIDSEDDWDNFLKEIDSTYFKQTNLSVPSQIYVSDCSTGKESLKSICPGLSIHIISFGSQEGARKWKEETKTIFPVFCDEARAVYQYFKLERSLYKVWNHRSISYYGEKIAQDISLPLPFEEIPDDPLQMGGDFIVKNSQLIMDYKSKTPADRPSIDYLKKYLSQCIDH